MTTSFRRSTIQGFTECPRRTLHEITLGLDVPRGNVGQTAELGQAAHAVIAEIVATLQRQDEPQMATEEAVVIMRHVMEAGSWVLGADELDDLRWIVLRFAAIRWQPNRIMGIERRMEAAIVCPDGVERTLFGTPDVVLADPPDGVLIVDWKTGLGKPRTPRELPEGGEPIVGKEYLSERGHFQGDSYGLLALRNVPRADRVIFREHHLRFDDPPREMVLSRPELEHVEWQLGLHMMLLDRALTEGEGSVLWAPRPGRHCARRCPVSRSCPVPAEQRGVGALESPELAVAEADRFVNVDGLRNALRDGLKAYHEETGEMIALSDWSLLGWHTDGNGRRAFKVATP